MSETFDLSSAYRGSSDLKRFCFRFGPSATRAEGLLSLTGSGQKHRLLVTQNQTGPYLCPSVHSAVDDIAIFPLAVDNSGNFQAAGAVANYHYSETAVTRSRFCLYS